MEETKLKISVITASYNYEELIKETIESVINQTYPHWELIIVDDGSNDNSVEVIKKYCKIDDRIKFFQHENGVNKGLKDTVLLGLEKASSEWVAFLESDDIFKLNCLEEKIKVIENNPETNFIFSDVEFFGDGEKIKNFEPYLWRKSELLKKRIEYTDLLEINLIPTFSCVMIKKELFNNCDFNCEVPQWLDWFLWMQLLQKTKVTYIRKDLTLWRLHPQSYINTTSEIKKINFTRQLLKTLNNNIYMHSLIDIYAFINKKRIEKFFRPQVQYLNNLILSCVSANQLNNKFIDIIKI